MVQVLIIIQLSLILQKFMNLWWEMDIIFIFISQNNNGKLAGIILYLEVVIWCCKFWNSSRNVYSTVEIELRCPSAITSVLLSFIGCLNIYQGKDHEVEVLVATKYAELPCMKASSLKCILTAFKDSLNHHELSSIKLYQLHC